MEGKCQTENNRRPTSAASLIRSQGFNSDGPDPLLIPMPTCPTGSDDVHSGRKCSSGSKRMRQEAAEAQADRLQVPLRESSLTRMASRYTCRERPRANGDTAITCPNAWLTARQEITEKGGDSRRPSLSGR